VGCHDRARVPRWIRYARSYGYCASHSRPFRGLRLHLVTTVHGLPVAFALSNAKTDEREALVDLVTLQLDMFHHPDGLILVVDKGYRDRDTETGSTTAVSPSCDRRTAPNRKRPGRGLLRAVRQNIESVNQTFKGQLDLEQHGGRTITGVTVRVLHRVLALTATIWHNWHTGQPILRSLVAYDH
jgi:hypothetical protein